MKSLESIPRRSTGVTGEECVGILLEVRNKKFRYRVVPQVITPVLVGGQVFFVTGKTGFPGRV